MRKLLWVFWLKYSNVISAEIWISKKSIASPLQKESMPVNQLHVQLLTIKGAIGPATNDYFVREINNANLLNNIPLIIITLDTHGALSASLSDINKSILNSHTPFACLVYPQGTRTASAGTYILYANHIAAISPATTLGAATLVNIAAPMTSPINKKKQVRTPATMEKNVSNEAFMLRYLQTLNEMYYTHFAHNDAISADSIVANPFILNENKVYRTGF
jgi:membrane-bound serine protease (ClpP class)